MMKTKIFFLFSVPFLFALLVGLSFSAQAAEPLQGIGQYQTPTAEPDGRIIYTVKEGDTCLKIGLINNIDENQLRAMNPDLDGDCIVIAGQRLMIGVGGPAAEPTITPGGPTPAPTQVEPTATPLGGTTEICVLLFEDVNGNAIREELELGLAGGAISVTNALGGYSQTRDSINEIDLDTLEPAYICLGAIPEGQTEVPEGERLPDGKYTVSAAIPDGYNPTSTLSYEIEVMPGERAFVAFGAQSQDSTIVDPEAENGSNNSGLLGIFGLLLLVGGGALAWYATRMQKPSAGMKYR
ncbi:MAG: LysM peptidoglycan-binding domain-containing protein [Gammaproteobacteria bacterium]|nr:LysM peptidoglycan-binding domain-containing protein [Gammaproteobacteria bacterium]